LSAKKIFLIFSLVLFLFISCQKDKIKSSESNGKNPDKIKIRVAQNSSVDHYYQVGLEKFKEVLEAETKGAVEVIIYPSAQLGNEEQEIIEVKLGIIDATIVSSGNLAPFVPEIGLFNLPFIFRDHEHFYKILDGHIGRQVGKNIEARINCVFLGYCSYGIRNVFNSKKPILTPADLKGMKIRVMASPILISSFNALGAQATSMSWNELYSALQQGVIDGAECGTADLLIERFYEVTKYVSYTNHLIGAAVLIFSKKRYKKLPHSIQTAVLTAGRAGVLAARKSEIEMSEQALKKLEAKGIEFFSVNKDLFREKVKPVYEKYAEKLGGMKLIEEIMRK